MWVFQKWVPPSYCRFLNRKSGANHHRFLPKKSTRRFVDLGTLAPAVWSSKWKPRIHQVLPSLSGCWMYWHLAFRFESPLKRAVWFFVFFLNLCKQKLGHRSLSNVLSTSGDELANDIVNLQICWNYVLHVVLMFMNQHEFSWFVDNYEFFGLGRSVEIRCPGIIESWRWSVAVIFQELCGSLGGQLSSGQFTTSLLLDRISCVFFFPAKIVSGMVHGAQFIIFLHLIVAVSTLGKSGVKNTGLSFFPLQLAEIITSC